MRRFRVWLSVSLILLSFFAIGPVSSMETKVYDVGIYSPFVDMSIDQSIDVSFLNVEHYIAQEIKDSSNSWNKLFVKSEKLEMDNDKRVFIKNFAKIQNMNFERLQS